MIHAGKVSDIKSEHSWSNGTWLFLDIGFSKSERTCGVLIHDTDPVRKTFGEAVNLVKEASRDYPVLNLVIEAPLSITFDKVSGNPVGRWFEKKDEQHRYWYAGLGCLVMVATLYLMRELTSTNPKGEIKLFEGFISFKTEKSDHLKDVKLLRTVVKDPHKYAKFIIEPTVNSSSEIKSAFEIMGSSFNNFGIPPVIMSPEQVQR